MQSDRFAREIVGILALSYVARSRRLMRNPFGGCGSVVGTPFSWHRARFVHARGAGSRRAGARGAGVVRRLVVRNARGARVVRSPVVRCARRAARDRVQRVVLTERPLCRRDRVQGVIPTERPLCRVVPCWGGARGWRHTHDGGQSAEPIVAADRCAREIGAFLTSSRAARAAAELNRSAATYHTCPHFNVF